MKTWNDGVWGKDALKWGIWTVNGVSFDSMMTLPVSVLLLFFLSDRGAVGSISSWLRSRGRPCRSSGCLSIVSFWIVNTISRQFVTFYILTNCWLIRVNLSDLICMLSYNLLTHQWRLCLRMGLGGAYLRWITEPKLLPCHNVFLVFGQTF